MDFLSDENKNSVSSSQNIQIRETHSGDNHMQVDIILDQTNGAYHFTLQNPNNIDLHYILVLNTNEVDYVLPN